MTPLMTAATEGDPSRLKSLLEGKAKTEARTEDGRTALMYAAGWGEASKVQLLLGCRRAPRSTNK
jgi:ankyrin repeat protein